MNKPLQNLTAKTTVRDEVMARLEKIEVLTRVRTEAGLSLKYMSVVGTKPSKERMAYAQAALKQTTNASFSRLSKHLNVKKEACLAVLSAERSYAVLSGEIRKAAALLQIPPEMLSDALSSHYWELTEVVGKPARDWTVPKRTEEREIPAYLREVANEIDDEDCF